MRPTDFFRRQHFSCNEHNDVLKTYCYTQNRIQEKMNSQKRNDATIYCLSSGPTLPEWLGERARRNLSKRDEQVRRRIELLQDFQMPSSSSKVVQSGDGRYIITAGTYPPRIRCYDVHELTMKFERYVDSHIQDVCMLGQDYGKLALLLEDRTIAFHAHYGAHETIRIPKFGRGMAYEPTTCDLLIAANGNHVYRLNLDEGRFHEPWLLEGTAGATSGVAATCISVSPSHPLASVGCDDGIVRFWDNRDPDRLLRPFLKLDVKSATSDYGTFADEGNLYMANPNEITSVAHDPTGLYMAAGTAGGLVALYDVRSSRPLHVKEHKHGMPIHTIQFHPGSGSIFSSDEKLVKIWKYKSSSSTTSGSGGAALQSRDDEAFRADDSNVGSSSSSNIGAIVANVEASSKFSHFLLAGDETDPTGSNSGLLLCATDQPKLESYFIPKVGLAPKWCSFLESITEELEERDLKRDGSTAGGSILQDGEETVFENYKFVSRDDLDKLGISHLIGTPLLRGYMHGFFMDINLYNRVRAVANPFEYEQYRKKKLKERLDAKRASRIAPKENSRKGNKAVNPELAERLMDKAEDGADTKAGKLANKILTDDRFGSLFTNPDYQIDEEDIEFKLRNPSGVAQTKNKKRRDDMDSDDDDGGDSDASEPERDDGMNEFLHRVGGSDDEQVDSDNNDDYNSEESDSDEDGFRGGKVRGEAYDQVKAMKKSQQRKQQQKGKSSSTKNKKDAKKKAVMYEADDLGAANDAAVQMGLGDTSATSRVKQQIRTMNMPLGKRTQLLQEQDRFVTAGQDIHKNGGIAKVTRKGGSKEITYIPLDRRRKLEEEAKGGKKQQNDGYDDDDDAGNKRNRNDSKRRRRGVKDLGFKVPFKNKS